MSLLNEKLQIVLRTEGAGGLPKRVISRLFRKPAQVIYYIFETDLYQLSKPVPAPMDLDILEVTGENEDDLEALTAFEYYGTTREHIRQFLAAGQLCFAAKHKGQLISCYWVAMGEFYDKYLHLSFNLADGEEYHLGAYTLPEFRGKGILPYFVSESSRMRLSTGSNKRVMLVVRTNNKSSQRSVAKMGFRRAGLIGFVEICSIRFHFLIGNNVLSRSTGWKFLEIAP